MTDDDKKRLLKMVCAAVSNLEEHFDTVQILCTKHHTGTTSSFEDGSGNMFARLHHCRDFVRCDDVRSQRSETQPLDPPDDDPPTPQNR